MDSKTKKPPDELELLEKLEKSCLKCEDHRTADERALTWIATSDADRDLKKDDETEALCAKLDTEYERIGG